VLIGPDIELFKIKLDCKKETIMSTIKQIHTNPKA
jgi:hypothetical protein